MKELVLKRRARVKTKEAKRILGWISDEFGTDPDPNRPVDAGSLDGRRAYITDGRLIAVEDSSGLILTLTGIKLLKPTRRWVTVDMGAVKYIANGADVMAPGIVDADPDIDLEMIVWVRDENNLQPLCVGRALMTGAEMRAKDSGKAVETLHHVGDSIWNLEL
jgi:PUA-domain protein